MLLAIFSSVGVWEIMILLAVLMALFGSSKVPSMARSLGRGVREFNETVGSTRRELMEPIEAVRDSVDVTTMDEFEELEDIDAIGDPDQATQPGDGDDPRSSVPPDPPSPAPGAGRGGDAPSSASS